MNYIKCKKTPDMSFTCRGNQILHLTAPGAPDSSESHCKKRETQTALRAKGGLKARANIIINEE